ncbi:XRE family transcriptional regulator, partial [Listeria monocytogenes]|nr:XRE family transcriptional regulator [Listeria monocytogenes]
IENEKRRVSYELAVKIANFFNMKPDDIFLDSILTRS